MVGKYRQYRMTQNSKKLFFFKNSLNKVKIKRQDKKSNNVYGLTL